MVVVTLVEEQRSGTVGIVIQFDDGQASRVGLEQGTGREDRAGGARAVEVQPFDGRLGILLGGKPGIPHLPPHSGVVDDASLSAPFLGGDTFEGGSRKGVKESAHKPPTHVQGPQSPAPHTHAETHAHKRRWSLVPMRRLSRYIVERLMPQP